MIQAKLFFDEMTRLCKRFGMAPESWLLEEYYEYLSDNLTDADFAQACKISRAEDTYFPSAKQLLEKVSQSMQSLAEQEWRKILNGCARNELPEQISAAAVLALDAVGGFDQVGRADISRDLPGLHSLFLRSYVLHARKINQSVRALVEGSSHE